MREVPERPQFILTEADAESKNDKTDYEFSYIFDGTKYEEDVFKQKLILAIKATDLISTYSVIPEVVELIVEGLVEGSKVRGFASFSLGTTPIMIRAKKVIQSSTNSNENDPVENTQ